MGGRLGASVRDLALAVAAAILAVDGALEDGTFNDGGFNEEGLEDGALEDGALEDGGLEDGERGLRVLFFFSATIPCEDFFTGIRGSLAGRFEFGFEASEVLESSSDICSVKSGGELRVISGDSDSDLAKAIFDLLSLSSTSVEVERLGTLELNARSRSNSS